MRYYFKWSVFLRVQRGFIFVEYVHLNYGMDFTLMAKLVNNPVRHLHLIGRRDFARTLCLKPGVFHHSKSHSIALISPYPSRLALKPRYLNASRSRTWGGCFICVTSVFPFEVAANVAVCNYSCQRSASAAILALFPFQTPVTSNAA